MPGAVACSMQATPGWVLLAAPPALEQDFYWAALCKPRIVVAGMTWPLRFLVLHEFQFVQARDLPPDETCVQRGACGIDFNLAGCGRLPEQEDAGFGVYVNRSPAGHEKPGSTSPPLSVSCSPTTRTFPSASHATT